MDESKASNVYEKPKVTDLGSLERLTADCGGSNDGDFMFTAGNGFGHNFTDSQGHTCGPT